MSQKTNQLMELFAKLPRNQKFMTMMQMHRMQRRLHDHSERTGASGLLVLLSKQDGLTNSEISELLDIRPSSVTAQVKNLEESGYIRREADENDKRVSRIYLTESGRESTKDLEEAHDDLSERIFGVLSDEEQDQLIGLLQKLVKANEGEQADDFDFPFGFGFGMRGANPWRMMRGMSPQERREFGRSMREMGREMRQAKREIKEGIRDSMSGFDFDGYFKDKPTKSNKENWDDF